MYTNVINIPLLALWCSDMFRVLRGHFQGVRLIRFHSQINKIRTCKILFIEQRVSCHGPATCTTSLFIHITAATHAKLIYTTHVTASKQRLTQLRHTTTSGLFGLLNSLNVAR